MPMRFDDRDIGWLAGILADAAVAEIMPRFRRLGAGDVRQKTSAADLVTEADVNAERVIAAAIAERYPRALVVGEEACEIDATLLPRLGAAELAFVVDPVDGTFNFASGVPLFGVMAAVVQDGETVAGIIHDPIGKDFLIGARGAGSHSDRGRRRTYAGQGGGARSDVANDRCGVMAVPGRTRALATGQEPDQMPVADRLSLRCS